MKSWGFTWWQWAVVLILVAGNCCMLTAICGMSILIWQRSLPPTITSTLIPNPTITDRPIKEPTATAQPTAPAESQTVQATATFEPTRTVEPLETTYASPTMQPTDISAPIPTGTKRLPLTESEAALCSCTNNLYNCGDFASQAAAQACFVHCGPIDVHGLDKNNNGQACEDFKYP